MYQVPCTVCCATCAAYYGRGRLSLQQIYLERLRVRVNGHHPTPHPSSRAARALAYDIKNADLADLDEH